MMIICLCADVNEEKIRESIKSGNKCIDSLIDDLDVCTGCGMCLPDIQKMINEECQKEQES